jgi:hypothetical protein
MAPELVLADRYPGSAPQATDVFGLGVVLHDLAHLGVAVLQPRTPGQSSSSSSGVAAAAPARAELGSGGGEGESASHYDVLLARYRAGFEVHAAPHCPPGQAALMRRCLAVDPAARPSARAALEELMALPAEA